jgi:ABC-type Mn2+/Zn2+ transport system permease subunit
MSDFLFLFGFAAIPLLTALAYAAITPVLGAALHLRGEIFLGIVLPPFGSAVIGLSVLGGVSTDSRLLLSCMVAASLLALLSSPMFGAKQANGTARDKETVLAAVFVLGQTVTYLTMHLSPRVHANLSHLLSGEILAAGPAECGAALAMTVVLTGFCFRFRGLIYAYCLDETGLKIRERRFWRIEATYRIVASVVVTAALVHVGPLLTTAWLVLPPLFAERTASGIEGFFRVGILMAIGATLLGFIAALAIDFPPVHAVSATLFLLGAGVLMIAKLLPQPDSR